MGSRVELFAAIRRDERVEGLSIRELAERHRVHRRTVRQALAVGDPAGAEDAGAGVAAAGAFKPVIDAMLREDLDAPRKQQHTARRVLARLVDEHRPSRCRTRRCGTTSPGAGRRSSTEAGKQLAEGFVPQTHAPGAEAEVDFADLWVDPARGEDEDCSCSRCGCRTRARRCTGRSPPRARRRSWKGTSTRSSQLGGVPTVHIRYDNLKSAVSRVLFGRNRVESERWVAFQSHYGFDAFYCQPGVDGAHEKGGVEGEGGRFRRNHCVPMPKVDSLAELNELLAAADAKRRLPADRQPGVDGRARTSPSRRRCCGRCRPRSSRPG